MMAMPVYPTIIIPGITASQLLDAYPLPPETIWKVLHKDYERVALHPDDLRYEVKEPARVIAGQIFKVAYREMIEELRHNLCTVKNQPVPVYPFAYDWRQPLDESEAQLGKFIDEVIDRTKLMRHYARAGYADNPKVNLVGHSMGGLVIAGYLQRTGSTHRVHKVATLASPFQGSFESVTKITTGTADLGDSEPSSREREAARLTPALYHLLPSFANGLTVASGLPNTMFNPTVWQPSIVATIKHYIRLHGLRTQGNTQQASELFNGLLTNAHNHRMRIDGLSLENIGLDASRWLCVVGVNSTTRVRLSVKQRRRVPYFDFRSSDRDNQWSQDDQQLRRLTGDGTVPFEGAVPQFLNEQNLICVTPDDYGYWEVQDRMLSAMAGFHGILPNMDMLHRMVVAHLSGRRDRYGNIWGCPAPGVTKEIWQPAIHNLSAKTN